MTDARVTQEAILVLHGGATSDARVTKEEVLVLHGGATSDARVTQEAVLVLNEATIIDYTHPCEENATATPYTPVTEQDVVKISQAPLQVLLVEASSKERT